MIRLRSRSAENNRAFDLYDQGGPWCAACLEYITPRPRSPQQRLEHSHIIRQAAVEQAFGNFLNEHWHVNAHFQCHRSALTGEENLAVALSDHLGTLQELDDTPVLERTAQELHNAGNYWMSLLAKLRLAEKLVDTDDIEGAWKNAEYCFASASALNDAGRAIDAMWKFIRSRELLEARPSFRLNQAKIAALRNDRDRADALIAAVEAGIPRLGAKGQSRLNAAVRRARASVRCNVPGACTTEMLNSAIRDAEFARRESPGGYTGHTGAILHMNLLVKKESFRAAQEVAEHEISNQTTPWGYKAMAYFHRAICNLQSGARSDLIYKDLVRAQYICCMLGIAGHSHRATLAFCPKVVDCMPADLLLRLDLFRATRPRQRTHFTRLREQAIGIRGKVKSIWHGVRDCLTMKPWKAETSPKS